MSEIRTELPSGEHIRVIGEGRAVLEYWPNIKPYYADILAAPHVQGTSVVWELGAEYAGEGRPEDIQAARDRLAQANARVDPVLETLAQIRQRKPVGRYYVCSDEEYRRIEQLMPRLRTAPGAVEEQKHLPAASLETLCTLLEQVRASLVPSELDPKQVVRTSEGPRIIGWGLVVFTPVRIIAPPPWEGPAAVAAVAAPPAEGAPARRKRRLWPWLLLPLGLLLLAALAALLWWWLGYVPALPFENHEFVLGAEGPYADAASFAVIHSGGSDQADPVTTGPVTRPIPPGMVPVVRAQHEDPWAAGSVALANVLGLREGFRVEARMAKSDRWLSNPPRWVLSVDPAEGIYCRQDGPDADDRVGVDLVLLPAAQRGVSGRFPRGGAFDIRPGAGEVLFYVEGDGVRSFYWIGVELDRPVRPKDLRMRVIEPARGDWPEGWRELNRPITLLRGDGADRRHFLIFLLMPAETIETYGDKVVKIELSDRAGSTRNLMARIVRRPDR